MRVSVQASQLRARPKLHGPEEATGHGTRTTRVHQHQRVHARTQEHKRDVIAQRADGTSNPFHSIRDVQLLQK
jgi:hypothetical protein